MLLHPHVVTTLIFSVAIISLALPSKSDITYECLMFRCRSFKDGNCGNLDQDTVTALGILFYEVSKMLFFSSKGVLLVGEIAY